MSEAVEVPPRARPRVTMNMAASLDGKISTVDGGLSTFGGPEDLAQMDDLRASADAVLIGGGTLRADDPPLLIRNPDVRRRRILSKNAPHPWNIVASSHLPEHPGGMRFFREPETEKIVFTTGRVPPERRAAVSRFARVETVASDKRRRVDLREVVERLWALGVRHLLLEGGGRLNFSMLQADLIDEIYLTICPLTFGGRTAPTVFDGAGLTSEHVRKFALQHCRVGSLGDVLLRYGRPVLPPGEQ